MPDKNNSFMNKVTYTPFIPEYKIPEASANLPVQLLRPKETTVDLTPAFPSESKSEKPEPELESEKPASESKIT